MEGTKLTYTAQTDSISQMQMYGLIKNDNNTVAVANRTFETMLYNLFTYEDELNNNIFFKSGSMDKSLFIKNGKLDMAAVLFKEKDGRELFLLYLKPIINGTGNYYIEAQTRTQTHTYVIVDFLGEQHIIETENMSRSTLQY